MGWYETLNCKNCNAAFKIDRKFKIAEMNLLYICPKCKTMMTYNPDDL